jgi:CMP/dCMP kinase
MIIAVDGPTASGKGTLAKALAAHFGLPFLDTGLLYRAVGRHVQLHQGNPDDPADALAGCDFPDSILDDPVLRNEEIGGLASRVSIHPNVRAALNKRQVDFANQPGGALLDGRDIGTVIAPACRGKAVRNRRPAAGPRTSGAMVKCNGQRRSHVPLAAISSPTFSHPRRPRFMGRLDKRPAKTRRRRALA